MAAKKVFRKPVDRQVAITSRSSIGTPISWRMWIGLVIGLLVPVVVYGDSWLGSRGEALIGFCLLIGLTVMCSANIRAIKIETIAWGVFLQLVIAVAVLKIEVGGQHPGEVFFIWIAAGVKRFLEFSDSGARFVFGDLADPATLEKAFKKRTFVFAFSALPTIIFVSSFFSLLHYLGVIQQVVYILSLVMRRLMKTSGAETLAAVENVFMGQSEAPLIVRGYLPAMSRSELLAVMTGGMATLSGGMIAVYVEMGVEPITLLTTGLMAAPCSLYVAKILIPEASDAGGRKDALPAQDSEHANALDAIASGATSGAKLAINIAAMIIAFMAFFAMVDCLISLIFPGWSLQAFFALLFFPMAKVIGIETGDAPVVASLLGKKLVSNEFVAFVELTRPDAPVLSARSRSLATFAVAGFANFSSIGIQLGAMGTLLPARRSELAQLGGLALIGGFISTLLNAAIAGILL